MHHVFNDPGLASPDAPDGLDEATRTQVRASLDQAIENGYDFVGMNENEIADDIGTYDPTLEGRTDLAPYVAEWQENRIAEDTAAQMALDAENRWQNGRRDPERWPEQQEEPPTPGGEPCHTCGKLILELQDYWYIVLVDLDPGNPEVGPQPDVANARIHQRCATPAQKAWVNEHGNEVTSVVLNNYGGGWVAYVEARNGDQYTRGDNREDGDPLGSMSFMELVTSLNGEFGRHLDTPI